LPPSYASRDQRPRRRTLWEPCRGAGYEQIAEIIAEGRSPIVGVANWRYPRPAGEGISSSRPHHGRRLTAGPPLQNFTRVTQARKHSLLPCCPAGKYRLTDDKEFRMDDQSKSSNPDQSPSDRRSRRGALLLALVAVAVLAGITGNLLSKAFG